MFGRERLGTRLAGGWPAGSAVESVSVKVTPGSAGGPANVVGTRVGTIKISVSGEHGGLASGSLTSPAQPRAGSRPGVIRLVFGDAVDRRLQTGGAVRVRARDRNAMHAATVLVARAGPRHRR